MRTTETSSRSDPPQEEGDTSRSSSHNSLRLLIKELGQSGYDPPDQEDFKMIESRIANGDTTARQEIFNRSLRYVFSIAWKKADYNPEIAMELFSEGSIGSCQASRNWNPKKGPFLGYAKMYIHGSISKWLSRDSHRSYIESISIEPTDCIYEEDRESNGYVVVDPTNNPEEEALKKYVTLEWLELKEQLFAKLTFHAKKIRNIRHRTFFMKVIEEGIPQYIFADLMDKKAIKQNYAETHLNWYMEFLEEELGEEVKERQPSKISRKFTNTLNDIWKRRLKDKILNDETARVIISQMIELVKDNGYHNALN